MSIRDFLDSVKKPEVIYSSFLMKYKSNVSYCFIEGNDWGYYYQVYSCHGITNIVPIVCYGKSNVIRLRDLINAKNPMPNTFYLIDKDYDEYKIESDLYMTPFYSVENFYASDKFISHLVRTECRYVGGEVLSGEDVDKITRIFLDRLNTFLEISIELNAWSFYTKNNFKFSLTQVKVEDVIKIRLEEVSLSLKLAELFEKYIPDEDVSVHAEEIKKIEERFSKNKFVHCRGKYLLQFVIAFLNELKKDFNKEVPQTVSRKCNFSKQLSDKTFISDFSTYSDKSKCIIDFVKKAA